MLAVLPDSWAGSCAIGSGLGTRCTRTRTIQGRHVLNIMHPVLLLTGVVRPELSSLSALPKGVYVGPLSQAPAAAAAKLVRCPVCSQAEVWQSSRLCNGWQCQLNMQLQPGTQLSIRLHRRLCGGGTSHAPTKLVTSAHTCTHAGPWHPCAKLHPENLLVVTLPPVPVPHGRAPSLPHVPAPLLCSTEQLPGMHWWWQCLRVHRWSRHCMCCTCQQVRVLAAAYSAASQHASTSHLNRCNNASQVMQKAESTFQGTCCDTVACLAMPGPDCYTHSMSHSCWLYGCPISA
jgi:hypothetical protein